MGDTDANEVSVLGSGRDAGKQFFIQEIPPREFAGYMLRLVAALRVESYEWLLEQVKESIVSIDAIMNILQGSDPKAVHALMNELLDGFVRVSPDPQHPGVKRELLPDDIRELKTLGDVLIALGKLHLDFSLG